MADVETTGLLHHDKVSARGARPSRWLYVLHGIYGAGRNWGTVIRRLCDARRDWGGVLIDLREHGQSRGFEPPHTIAAAAADLARLAHDSGPSPGAVLGHSFGGKVALAFARICGAPLQVWLIDSTPAAREPGGSAWDMLRVVRGLPTRFDSRDQAVVAMTSRGVARPVAQWMTTNLEYENGGYVWRLDLDAMEALLSDFFRTDLWPVVEAPPTGVTVHVVKATESSVLDTHAIDRIHAAARATGRVHYHTVEGGHWVNADNPDALIELLSAALPTEQR